MSLDTIPMIWNPESQSFVTDKIAYQRAKVLLEAYSRVNKNKGYGFSEEQILQIVLKDLPQRIREEGCQRSYAQ